jgi:hypothetical protein
MRHDEYQQEAGHAVLAAHRPMSRRWRMLADVALAGRTAGTRRAAVAAVRRL